MRSFFNPLYNDNSHIYGQLHYCNSNEHISTQTNQRADTNPIGINSTPLTNDNYIYHTQFNTTQNILTISTGCAFGKYSSKQSDTTVVQSNGNGQNNGNVNTISKYTRSTFYTDNIINPSVFQNYANNNQKSLQSRNVSGTKQMIKYYNNQVNLNKVSETITNQTKTDISDIQRDTDYKNNEKCRVKQNMKKLNAHASEFKPNQSTYRRILDPIAEEDTIKPGTVKISRRLTQDIHKQQIEHKQLRTECVRLQEENKKLRLYISKCCLDQVKFKENDIQPEDPKIIQHIQTKTSETQSPYRTNPLDHNAAIKPNHNIPTSAITLVGNKRNAFVHKTMAIKLLRNVKETFYDSANLYYYLRYTINLQLNHQFAIKYKENLIVNVDLHHKMTLNKLYAILSKNTDANTDKYEWILKELLEDKFISNQYYVPEHNLPLSFRDQLKISMDKKFILSSVNNMKLKFLPIVKQKSNAMNKCTVTMTATYLRESIINSVKNEEDFIPILKFKNNQHWIEFVLIYETPDKRFNFGISFNGQQRMNATSIFLDKLDIVRQNMLTGGKPKEFSVLNTFKGGLKHITIKS
eukprot:334199_1